LLHCIIAFVESDIFPQGLFDEYEHLVNRNDTFCNKQMQWYTHTLKFMGLSFQLRQVCACVNVKDGETDRRDAYGSNLFPPLFTPANLFYSVFTT